jgi:hypothetical protein
VSADAGGPAPAAGVDLDRRLDYQILLRMIDPDGLRMLAERLRTLDDVGRADAGVAPAPAPAVPAPGAPGRAGWGLEHDVREEIRVAEITRFEARGEVTTSDGRRIAMDLELEMARLEVQTRSASVRAGDARKVDPLVVNLTGGPVAFDGRHDFDLDADGRPESIARLGPASAYLAIDRDGDGAVADGRELFGPATGDGFAELAAHDADGNGWIDEADPVFRELLLWRPGEGGDGGTLVGAAAAGLGAIHVGRVATVFSVGSGGAAVAEVAETGVYVKEDGTPATIQHVDLWT